MVNGIKKDSYREMQDSDKLNVLFDLHKELYNELKSFKFQKQTDLEEQKDHCSRVWIDCDERFKKIESKGYKILGALIFLNFAIPIIAYIMA